MRESKHGGEGNFYFFLGGRRSPEANSTLYRTQFGAKTSQRGTFSLGFGTQDPFGNHTMQMLNFAVHHRGQMAHEGMSLMRHRVHSSSSVRRVTAEV
jgi:hypothetical protein